MNIEHHDSSTNVHSTVLLFYYIIKKAQEEDNMEVLLQGLHMPRAFQLPPIPGLGVLIRRWRILSSHTFL